MVARVEVLVVVSEVFAEMPVEELVEESVAVVRSSFSSSLGSGCSGSPAFTGRGGSSGRCGTYHRGASGGSTAHRHETRLVPSASF